VSDTEEFSGRLEASEFVSLRPRVSGTVDKVYFSDGAIVKKDQLLFLIDPRPFSAALAHATSLLVAAQARADLAHLKVARAQKLLEVKAISQQDFDQLNAESRTADADIKTAEADVRSARLNLDYTAVASPITGRVSRTSVTQGNLVNEQVILTSIAGLSKIYAYFDLSEQTYFRVKQAKNTTPIVRMALLDEINFPHEGKIDFIDNQLNPQTGAIRVRGVFDNPQGEFTPGMAVKLLLITSSPYVALIVPERAIGTDQTKKFVFVVGTDNLPQLREVKLGSLINGMRVIVSHQIKAGEQVIVDGLQRVIPGVPVAPHIVKIDELGS
jgi:multidrug efflux system membrane fusion protein